MDLTTDMGEESDTSSSCSDDDEGSSDYDDGDDNEDATGKAARLVSASSHSSSTRNIVPLPRRAPTFENMCGSSFVYGFSVRESDVPAACLPPAVSRCHANNCMRRYWKTGIKQQQQQMMMMGVMDDARSSKNASMHGYRGSSSSSRRHCFDVYSIYGNLRLRRDVSGTHVTFKVKMSISAACEVVSCVCVCVCLFSTKTEE